jgi:hypothetical protein
LPWPAGPAAPGAAPSSSSAAPATAISRRTPWPSTPQPAEFWTIYDAQRWDCYGWKWSANAYPYLDSQRVIARLSDGNQCNGDYLFSVAPADDGFSAEPSQNKEFTFIALDNGRLTIQPTDYVLFADTSFTTPEWPTGIRRQRDIHSCE